MLTTLVALLAAATIAVPLSRRAGFGSVLGYLLAGIAIGPAGLRLVTNVDEIANIASLGVVMLLFLIGLELRPQRLWVMRRAVFGLGTAQVVLCGAALAALAHAAAGVGWAGRGGAGRRPGDVLHRHRAADAGRARPADHPRRPRRLRRAAVPGPRVHPAGGAGAAAGRRPGAAGPCALARRGPAPRSPSPRSCSAAAS